MRILAVVIGVLAALIGALFEINRRLAEEWRLDEHE